MARRETAAMCARRVDEIIDSLGCRFRRARLQRSRRHLAFGPDRAILEVFLLPDRYSALEGVNGKPAGIEGGGPVRRAYCDEYASLPNQQAPETVGDGHEVDRIFLVHLHCNFADFCECHGFISLVIKIERAASVRMIANASVESDHGSIFGRADMTNQDVLVDWVAH